MPTMLAQHRMGLGFAHMSQFLCKVSSHSSQITFYGFFQSPSKMEKNLCSTRRSSTVSVIICSNVSNFSYKWTLLKSDCEQFFFYVFIVFCDSKFNKAFLSESINTISYCFFFVILLSMAESLHCPWSIQPRFPIHLLNSKLWTSLLHK